MQVSAAWSRTKQDPLPLLAPFVSPGHTLSGCRTSSAVLAALAALATGRRTRRRAPHLAVGRRLHLSLTPRMQQLWPAIAAPTTTVAAPVATGPSLAVDAHHRQNRKKKVGWFQQN